LQDPLETLEKILAIADKIRPPQEPISGAATESDSNLVRAMAAWQPSITALITNFPAIVAGVKLAMRKEEDSPLRPHAAHPLPKTVDATTATAEPAPIQQEPASAAQPQPTELPASQSAPPMDPTKAVLNYVLRFATPTMLDHLENGDGTSFAQWLCETTIILPDIPPPVNKLPGHEALQFARSIGGRNQIIAAYKTAPALWQQIAPTPEAEHHFAAFLDDFLKYDPDATDGEPD
jgi:hypothetical protein